MTDQRPLELLAHDVLQKLSGRLGLQFDRAFQKAGKVIFGQQLIDIGLTAEGLGFAIFRNLSYRYSLLRRRSPAWRQSPRTAWWPKSSPIPPIRKLPV
jgi:hypothetical protein